MISGELGEPVLAATDGEVTGLKNDARNGNMIVMNIGDGYEVVFEGESDEFNIDLDGDEE